MYRTCIFCSRDLGTNEVVEHFPVGSRIAFDSAKGRLWAVCTHCMRWNLAPIEERWEAVEEAERRFVDARIRVQSENIGMAKMRDGTHLIRIGQALTGEIAALRYGSQFVKRRRNLRIAMAGIAVGTVAMIAGLPFLSAVGIPTVGASYLFQGGQFLAMRRRSQRILLSLDAAQSPTGEPVLIRQRHMRNVRLTSVDGRPALDIPDPSPTLPWYRPIGKPGWLENGYITITGDAARNLTTRAMVSLNSAGASKKQVADAVDLLENVGSAQAVLDQITNQSPTLFSASPDLARHSAITADNIQSGRLPDDPTRVFTGPHYNSGGNIRILDKTALLALEMALHDESERRAMEGELSVLEEAWREAEMIARIADALPDEPPEDEA